jgi:hypothetical protein
MSVKFIYIQYGDKDIYCKELMYSLYTLLELHDLSNKDLFVYTDNVAAYEKLPITPIDIKEHISDYSLNGRYHFRIKPCVMHLALNSINPNEKLIFLDTDTYIKKSLNQVISQIDNGNALMNDFEKKNPYPSDRLDNLLLRSGKFYSYTHDSIMFNSGLIGVSTAHKNVFVECVDIIDGMLGNGFKAHTIEQCALSEAFRINQINVKAVSDEICHYWRSSDKKYMHREIAKQLFENDLASLKKINHNWLKARIGKYMNL